MQSSLLQKIGEGSLGGKARGLGFFASNLDIEEWNRHFAPHRIKFPKTLVIGANTFDAFVRENHLFNCIDITDDAEIKRRFLAAKLSPSIIEELKVFLNTYSGPLAVRSSSLNEDALNYPFAGLYLTLLIPNNHPQLLGRLRQLVDAIKLVYASTYFQAPKIYMRNYSLSIEDERMAVIIQELIGRRYSNYFYPHVAGVVQSLNFFPIGSQKVEDGIALLVFGIGKKAVEGGEAMRFSPKFPTIRPQFMLVRDILKTSQRDFLAIDMCSGEKKLTGNENDTLVNLNIEVAGEHGTLREFASTIDEKDGVLYEGPFRKGKKVLTFNRLIRGIIFPLPDILVYFIEKNEKGFGCPVEIEFALNLFRKDTKTIGEISLLQVRPLVVQKVETNITLPKIPKERVILHTKTVLGHGILENIQDIVYISSQCFHHTRTQEIGKEVSKINSLLSAKNKKYILIGPGRWGSINPYLGIPVTYPQISNAQVIIEISPEDFKLEPSQGTHFFHNITSGQIIYLGLDEEEGDYINRDWFESQKNQQNFELVKHIFFPKGLKVVVDGRKKEGIIYIPMS